MRDSGLYRCAPRGTDHAVQFVEIIAGTVDQVLGSVQVLCHHIFGGEGGGSAAK